MPGTFDQPLLDTVPGVIAGLTPPERRIKVEPAPGGGPETLTLSFYRDEPCLVIVKDAGAGLFAVQVAPPQLGGHTALDDLLLNRDRPPRSNDIASIYGLAEQALTQVDQAAREAAAGARKTLRNGRVVMPAKYLAGYAARGEAKARLTLPELNRLNRRIREFLGAERCRLADRCYGPRASVASLNLIQRTGYAVIRDFAKTDPKLACLAMAELTGPPAAWVTKDYLKPPGTVSREYLTEAAATRFRKAAAKARLPEPDMAETLAKIDVKTLRAVPNSAMNLGLILTLAAAADDPVPHRIMRQWIIQRAAWYGSPMRGALRDRNWIRVFTECCRLHRQDPRRYGLKPLTWALDAFRFGQDSTLDDVDSPNSLFRRRLTQALQREETLEAEGPSSRLTGSRKRPDEVRLRIEELWADPARRQAALAAARSGMVEISGDRAAVTAGAGGPVLYEVRRWPDGRLDFRPDPAQAVTIDGLGRIRHHGAPQLPALNAAAAAAALSLDPELPHDAADPRLVQAATAVRYLASRQGEHDFERSDRLVSERITEAVNAMIDPEAARRAHRAAGWEDSPDATVTVPQHNAARLAGESLDQLAETNPGAAAWLILAGPHRVTEPVNHPGQLVTIARRDAGWRRHQGNDRPPWKTLAATRPVTLRRLARSPDYRQEHRLDRRMTLAAIAAAAAAGARELTPEMAQICESLASRDGIQPDVDATLLQYCFREPVAALAVGDLTELRDYCRGRTPTAATFSGLRKASHRWHRDLQEEQRRAGLESRAYRQWESAIGRIALSNGIVAEALTDTIMLGVESRDMNHCVFQYDEYCARGRSRIFHLSSGATAQLTLQRGAWEASQVRRTSNHPALAEEQEAAEELALRYTEAAKRPGRRAGKG